MYVFCSYTKSHIHDIADMTIEEVAKACHTSKGQISKCAKNLGFTSYLEFKDACIDYIHSFQDKPFSSLTSFNGTIFPLTGQFT